MPPPPSHPRANSTAGGGEGSHRRCLGVGGEGGSSMFARGSAGAAGRSRRVCGGFPHPQAGFQRRMLALLPRPGRLESPDRRMGLVQRRWCSFRWPPPPPAAPPASPALPPPPESITTAGPRRPRLFGARPPPPPTSLRTETKPSGGCRPRPAWLAGKAAGPVSLAKSSSRPTPGAAGSVSPAGLAQAAAPCRARAPQPGPGSSWCMESPLFSSLQ